MRTTQMVAIGILAVMMMPIHVFSQLTTITNSIRDHVSGEITETREYVYRHSTLILSRTKYAPEEGNGRWIQFIYHEGNPVFMQAGHGGQVERQVFYGSSKIRASFEDTDKDSVFDRVVFMPDCPVTGLHFQPIVDEFDIIGGIFKPREDLSAPIAIAN